MAYEAFQMNSGGSSVKGIGSITAAASNMRRARVLEIEMGNASAPADNAFIFIIQRCTTAGTGTGSTPNMLDPADTLAATIVVTNLISVDATLTAGAFLMNWPVNQRGSVRYVAAPGAELVVPATASNGLMLGFSAATTTLGGASATILEM